MVARGLGEGDVDVEPFLAIKREGVRVHFADGAATELLHQVVDGRLAWPNWIRARTRLQKVLDREDPVLLGGREGLIWRGGQLPVGDEHAELPQQRAALRAIWKAMPKSSSVVSSRRERTPFDRIFEETMKLIPNAQQRVQLAARFGFDEQALLRIAQRLRHAIDDARR